MNGSIVAINAGSSSVKFASFDIAPDAPPRRVLHGEVEGIGSAPHLSAWAHEGEPIEDITQQVLSGAPHAASELDAAPTADASDAALGAGDHHRLALEAILSWLDQHPSQGQPLAVVHRLVHGGERFTQPTRVTAEVLAQLQQLTPLAPLHLPHQLSAIAAIAALRPQLPQMACFDTAFHAGQDWVNQAYALPQRLSRSGVKHYGFHGLSYEYIASVLPAHLGAGAEGKVVVAHLGNGASLCAMQARRSVATSMGFSTLDGLMMGTRCGQLDPGVVLYLMQARGMSADEVETLLYTASGLLGVSGLSSDMRTLEASMHPDARAAIDLFVHRIRCELGVMAAQLSGLDALVFTGGIGAHSAYIRERVCQAATWLGIEVDVAANAHLGNDVAHRPASRISTNASGASAWVIPTNEEQMLVMHAQALLGKDLGKGDYA